MDIEFCQLISRKKTLIPIFMISIVSIAVLYSLEYPYMNIITLSRFDSSNISTLNKTRTNNYISNTVRSIAARLTGVTKHEYLYENKDKPTCSERKKWKYKPMTKNLPLTALASPWRSGNTWLRHLLQMATGIGTTSQYCDIQLLKGGYPFECARKDFAKFIVKKTHMPNIKDKKPQDLTSLQDYQRAVVIIRDPYTFIVANVYSGHTEVVPESNFFTTKFQKIGQPRMLEWWKMFNNYWLNEFKGQVYPVLYTNFVRNVDSELRKLLQFLRIKYTDEDIACAVQNKEGKFHRRARVWTRISNIKELFSSDMKHKIDKSVSKVADILKRKYDINWTNDTYIVNQKIKQ